ncbi:hypothetical protein B9Z55_016665 [Caenorhabditis nigoni]|uniref:C-type lectin domain-containing protein n=1 Tax=Caenorhabditis nigoni TaxID=1611254 RepID=A0A2G5T699_9PELO|nr:hypothetical protein B9Z55_016665 [Caenorhabditis nigoni]
MKPIASLFCFLSILQHTNALNLNDIKKMKTNPTTIATTTTTTGAPEYITFTMTTPGAMLTDCPAGCASGWLYYGSKCYKKFDTPATHSQAVTNCQLQGGELVQIDSSSENDALRKAFDTNALVDETKETWIGLASTSGSWKWTDGSTASFTNWAQTQPSSGQQCVQMITDALTNSTYQYQRGGWKTYDCSKTSASYICERDANV